MPRIAKADVNRALELVARAIVDAGGADGRTSRAEMKSRLPGLPAKQRALADIFFKFIDHRDFKSGAQVTKADVARAVSYAKTHMVAKYDLDNNGLSRDEVARMSLTGRRAVDLARTLKGVAEPGGPAPRLSDAKVAALIEEAIAPLGGADPKLTRSIRLSDAPPAVRKALEKAGKEIDARSFSGTDYSAGVEGYYAIYASKTDKTVVGYAVYGTGAGEPDYHDGMVVGFNLQGKRIAEYEDNG